jgi:hypothetical protein
MRRQPKIISGQPWTMKDTFHVDVENSPPPGRGVEIRAGSAPDKADAGWVAALQPDGYRLAGHAVAEAFSVKALARPLRAIFLSG